MNDKLDKAKKMLESLNNALAAGPWNENKYILILGKKIKELRDEFSTLITNYESGETGAPEYLAHRAHLNANLKLVYIGLYSSEGVNIVVWQRIVANLQRQIVSRPVYTNEVDIQKMIKTKEKKINEAYVSIYVQPEDILDLPTDKLPVDKLGKPMLVLKDNAINLENIDLFYHFSSKYRYSRGQLILVE